MEYSCSYQDVELSFLTCNHSSHSKCFETLLPAELPFYSLMTQSVHAHCKNKVVISAKYLVTTVA